MLIQIYVARLTTTSHSPFDSFMKPSISRRFRILLLLLVVSAIGLAGCDTTGVQPDIHNPDAPMSESEFKARMAKNGVVVLSPEEYEAFGITDRDVDLVERSKGATTFNALDCTTIGGSSSGALITQYTYSVCSGVTTQTVYNVDYFRVTIDAEITKNFLCPGDPVLQQEPTLSGPQSVSTDAETDATLCPRNIRVTSTTTRGDGVVLQSNQTDSGSTFAGTNFVALYPKADDFTFSHRSFFEPVDNSILKFVAP